MNAVVGFHEGELEVQLRAGVRNEAARLAGMLDPTDLGSGASRFLSERELAVLAARDHDGQLWISPLVGAAGFLEGHRSDLAVGAAPTAPDPLAGLHAGQPVGVVAIDFATRRRMRINGTLNAADPHSLRIDVEQAYGNCPQYIHRRQLRPAPAPDNTDSNADTQPRTTLDAQQQALVQRADTFFLGTSHPTRGADASHRGGLPGFVTVDGSSLCWPDYPGNNMFNSLGNLAVDDTAALLFIDFATGSTLHLSGTASIDWAQPNPDDAFDTGRRVRFTIERVVNGAALGVTTNE